MSNISENLADIESRLADLQSRLGPLHEQVKGLSSKIGEFSGLLKTWGDEAEAARSELESLGGSLDPIRSLLASTKAAGEHVSAEQAEARQARESMQVMFGDALQVVSRFIETAQKVGLLDRDKAAELLHAEPVPSPALVAEPVPAPVSVVEPVLTPPAEPVAELTAEPVSAPVEPPILPQAGLSEAELREGVPAPLTVEPVPSLPEMPPELPEEVRVDTVSIEEDSIEAAAVEETPELVDELVADLQDTPPMPVESPVGSPIESVPPPMEADPGSANADDPATRLQDVHPVDVGMPLSRPLSLPPHLSEPEPPRNDGPEPDAGVSSTEEIVDALDLSPLRLDAPPADVPEVDDETEDAIEAMLADMSKPITTARE